MKGMATHSSILVWRIPWTEEPGRLQSMGSQSQTRLSDSHFRASLLSCCQFPYMALFPCLDPYSLLFCLVIYSSTSEDPAQLLPPLRGFPDPQAVGSPVPAAFDMSLQHRRYHTMLPLMNVSPSRLKNLHGKEGLNPST